MTSRSQPEETPDVEGAIQLLRGPDVELRQFVAYLLGRVGDRRAIEPLIDALQDDHPGVRGAAANALGAIGDETAVPYLRPLLKNSNEQLVVWAAYALTMLGQDHFQVIGDALHSEDVAVRRSAILAIQQMGEPRAIPLLVPLSNDTERRFDGDSTVGEAAVKALTSLGYKGEHLPPPPSS
jgi:HEAT repeat protein